MSAGYQMSVLWQEYQHKLQLLAGGNLPGFAPSAHYQEPNPYGGVSMYYTGGFLPAGAGQTGSFGGGVGGILGAVTSGLQTFLPTLFQSRPGGGFGQVPAPVPPTQTVPPTHPVIGAAGNSGGMMGGGAAGRAHVARYAPAGTRGYHPPKHPGRCSQVPAGAWVRNRHRNVANIHALRRAISRLHGFERICRKVVHFVKPHTRGRPVFRRRRKRS